MSVIKKGNNQELRIEAAEFQGRTHIDVRLWVYSQSAGEYIPTRRGITVAPGEVDALVEGLRMAEGRMVRNAQVENVIKP